jgi:hypothetical protein
VKPRALNFLCGAGGATIGLQLAGFYVTGVDIKATTRHVGDALQQPAATTFPLDGLISFGRDGPVNVPVE